MAKIAVVDTAKKKKKAPPKAEEIWGKATMRAGYTTVPNMLLEHFTKIGMDCGDLAIALFLIRQWWTEDNKPFASKQTIADAVGLSARRVQERIKNMEQKGLIQRVQREGPGGRHTANIYDPTGLVKALEPYAHEALKEREKKARARRGYIQATNKKNGLQAIDGIAVEVAQDA